MPGFAAISAGVVGAVLATAQTGWRMNKRAVIGLCVVGLIGVLAALFANKWLWPVIGNGRLLLLTVSTTLLLIGLYRFDKLGKPLRLRAPGWLQSFGRLSYEIYLTHMFVVWPMVLAFKASGISAWWGVLIYPPTIALCWLLGWLVARYISQPAEHKIKQKFKPQTRLITPPRQIAA